MYFWLEPEGVILHVGNLGGKKTRPHPCGIFRGRMVSVSFISSEKYELQMI